MFTGIIEALGEITEIAEEKSNRHFWISSAISDELKVDQSIAHNGVCLTVTALLEGRHRVTAIKETLEKSTLGGWQIGDKVNLERCMTLNGRLDGHIVQGHVDTTGKVVSVIETDGSWEYEIHYDMAPGNITVPKGSITVNGVSLTVVKSAPGIFSVAIIPYTYAHTTFHTLSEGASVNLEFDIIGKYVAALLSAQQ
jgi:riboflavin synthase